MEEDSPTRRQDGEKAHERLATAEIFLEGKKRGGGAMREVGKKEISCSKGRVSETSQGLAWKSGGGN